MTIHAWRLLRKLKKAQIHIDGQVGIDAERMYATTVHISGKPFKEVRLKRYSDSLDATLDYLHQQNCIKFHEKELIQVTYTGWYLFSSALLDMFRGLILNIIIPIVVSVAAAIVTTLLMR